MNEVLQQYETFLFEQRQPKLKIHYYLEEQFLENALRYEQKVYSPEQSFQCSFFKIFNFENSDDEKIYNFFKPRMLFEEQKVYLNLRQKEHKSNAFLREHEDIKKYLLDIYEKEMKKKMDKDFIQKEKENWIEEHGTPHLKKSFRMGYSVQRQYIEERAQFEFPEFELDFDGKCKWKERVSPSAAALELEEKLKNELLIQKKLSYKVRTVWMTDPPLKETLVIQNYLQRYTLFKSTLNV